MTDLLSAAAAISRIPGIEPAKTDYRSLGGGLSNRTWLVQTEDRKMVLRLDGPQVDKLGLDRRTEIAILEKAAGQGMAPDVVFADADAGILVYEYLSGRSWSAADLEREENLASLAQLLRKVHALPKSGVLFDAPGAAGRYIDVIRGNGELLSFGLRCREIVDNVPRPVTAACCHNDIVAANVVATPDLRLLDWEYACDNEPLFDLASLIGYHDLGATQTAALLRAYTGRNAPEDRERLDLQLRLFDALQWLWFAVRQVLMPNDPQRDRLERIARRIRAN